MKLDIFSKDGNNISFRGPEPIDGLLESQMKEKQWQMKRNQLKHYRNNITETMAWLK